jgi:hypothetical protein
MTRSSASAKIRSCSRPVIARYYVLGQSSRLIDGKCSKALRHRSKPRAMGTAIILPTSRAAAPERLM